MEVGSKATHEGSKTCEAINWSNKTQEEGTKPIDVICTKPECQGAEHTENSRRSSVSVSVAALCQGVSKVGGSAMPNTAVSGVQHSENEARHFVHYKVCMGEQELMNAIGLEQSLGGSFGGGNISFDQKLQFVNSLKVSIHSVSIVIHARKGLGLSTVTQAELRSDLAAPVTDEELRRFFRSYGDSFVSEMERGGEYISSFTFYSQSVEQQHSVSLSIQGQGIGLWGEVNASLSAQVEKVTKESNVSVEFSQYITGIQHPSLPTPENCIDFSLRFPEMVLDAPAIISYTTSGYELVPKMHKFQSIARNRELLAGGSPDDKQSFRGLLIRVNSLKNAIAQIRAIHNFYRIDSEGMDPKLASVESEADADQRFLRAIIESYLDDPLRHIDTPTGADKLPSLKHGIPVLNIRTTVVGDVHGAPGQTPFDDVGDPMAFCQQFTRITSITLKSGIFIDLLAVTYSTGLGSITGSTTINHGRTDHGNLQPILSVPTGRHVTFMSNAYWPKGVPPLEGLQLTINDGRSVIGGRFNAGTIQQSYYSNFENSFMLGFKGRSGWYLDQVQLIYGIFGSSTWEQPLLDF